MQTRRLEAGFMNMSKNGRLVILDMHPSQRKKDTAWQTAIKSPNLA